MSRVSLPTSKLLIPPKTLLHRYYMPMLLLPILLQADTPVANTRKSQIVSSVVEGVVRCRQLRRQKADVADSSAKESYNS